MDKKGNILIVDDSTEILSLLSKLLNEEGFTTFPANSGELALASIMNRIPDLILLDIRMPGIDGFEVCRRIKANIDLNQIPIIFLTADADLKDKIKGLRLGAVDYITKPFEKEELLQRVKTQLELYTYHKLFRERTAEQLIEKEKLLNQQNIEYKLLNQNLEECNHTTKNVNAALIEKNEECRITSENLLEANIKLKNAIQKLEQSENQLNALNADKDRFLTILAHDLKNPLSTLLGFSGLLVKNIHTYDMDKIEKHLNTINQTTITTFKLLEDILLWVRAQSGKIPFEPKKLNFFNYL